MRLRVLLLLFSLMIYRGVAFGADPRPVEPRDCVLVRYPYDDGFNAIYGSLVLNQQGDRLAFIVREPDLAANKNIFRLYVKDLTNSRNDPGTVVLSGSNLSHATWLEDGRRLAVLSSGERASQIIIIDTRSKVKSVAVASDREITQYTIASNGRRMAIVQSTFQPDKKPRHLLSESDIENGYEIHFDRSQSGASVGDDMLSVSESGPTGRWSVPAPVTIRDPITLKTKTTLPRIRHLSMSPGGSRLIFSYDTKDLGTDRWDVAVMYDLSTGKVSIPFKGQTDSVPLWSADGASYLIDGHSPRGSTWAKEDESEHFTSEGDANLFLVTPSAGRVEEVFRHLPDHHELPLAWSVDGTVTLHIASSTVATFKVINGIWKEVSRYDLPLSPAYRYSIGPLVSSESQIYGIYQTPTVPPDLFSFDIRTGSVHKISDLNPQLSSLTLAQADLISWKTPNGNQYQGFLFKPINYDPAVRYPLVIQTKGNQGWFACDSGFTHDPSFIPQPLASSGIMYLIPTTQDPELPTQRKGDGSLAPGELSEVETEMSIWESAVHDLSSRRLIDETKVGIIGFSRTGWHVEFYLAHSVIRFAAATAADNVQYSLGEYWLLNDSRTIRDSDAMYGGPPYGNSFETWKRYSISFNLDKIYTPLLMENMGYGVVGDIQGEIPLSLAPSYEVFVGLNRLLRPVDFYYYPLEQHAPEHPKARLASLQRNLDWYRFWLQGFERPGQESFDQYKLWEHLRELRDAGYRVAGIPLPDVSKPHTQAIPSGTNR